MSYNKEIFEDKKVESAYQKIKTMVLSNTLPVDSPVAVILGGLPGAGKGNIYDIYDESSLSHGRTMLNLINFLRSMQKSMKAHLSIL